MIDTQQLLSGEAVSDWRTPAEECKLALGVAAISMMLELRVAKPFPERVAWYPSRHLYAPVRITTCLDDALVLFDRAQSDGFNVRGASLIVVWPRLDNQHIAGYVREAARTGYYVRVLPGSIAWGTFRWRIEIDRRFVTSRFPNPAKRDPYFRGTDSPSRRAQARFEIDAAQIDRAVDAWAEKRGAA